MKSFTPFKRSTISRTLLILYNLFQLNTTRHLSDVKLITFFSYEVEQPSDNTYGTEMPNGSWNGMIGMITEHVSCIRIIFCEIQT